MSRAARTNREKRRQAGRIRWLATLAAVWAGGCLCSGQMWAEDARLNTMSPASISSRRPITTPAQPKEPKPSLVDLYRAKTGAKGPLKKEQPLSSVPVVKPNLVPAILKTATTDEAKPVETKPKAEGLKATGTLPIVSTNQTAHSTEAKPVSHEAEQLAPIVSSAMLRKPASRSRETTSPDPTLPPLLPKSPNLPVATDKLSASKAVELKPTATHITKVRPSEAISQSVPVLEAKPKEAVPLALKSEVSPTNPVKAANFSGSFGIEAVSQTVRQVSGIAPEVKSVVKNVVKNDSKNDVKSDNSRAAQLSLPKLAEALPPLLQEPRIAEPTPVPAQKPLVLKMVEAKAEETKAEGGGRKADELVKQELAPILSASSLPKPKAFLKAASDNASSAIATAAPLMVASPKPENPKQENTVHKPAEPAPLARVPLLAANPVMEQISDDTFKVRTLAVRQVETLEEAQQLLPRAPVLKSPEFIAQVPPVPTPAPLPVETKTAPVILKPTPQEALPEGSPFEVIEEKGRMTVMVRRSKLLRTQVDVYRTAVVDDGICEVVQFTPREVSIIGKSTGATHVTFWFEDPNMKPLTYLVAVEPDTEEIRKLEQQYLVLEQMIAEMFPNSKVRLIVAANKLIVKGQARDSEEASQIMSLIRSQQQGIFGRNMGGGFGSLNEGVAAAVLTDAAQGSANRPNLQIVNMLRVPGVQQVALRVKIAELNRTAARNFGVDVNGLINVTENVAGSKLFLTSLLNSTNGATVPILGQFDGDDIKVGLNYLQQQGVVKLLAEPTLVTLSGRPATFVAGGEFAVPTAVGVAGLSAVSTDFRAFGSIISFLPTIVDKDRIRLQVSPEFSQVNASLSVNNIPGLRTRTANTTVEMREGQTLAIAGLLEENMTGNTAGNLPFLARVFGKRSMTRSETELIILVTPELVHPMEPEEVPPLPGFDVTEPTNAEFYLHGSMEGNPTREYRSTVWPRLHKRYGSGGPAMTSGPFGHGQ